MLDQPAQLWLDKFRRVTLLALNGCMLPFQGIAGLDMVKLLSRWVPADEPKIFAVVFGMAAGALLAGAGGNVVGRVKTLVSRNAAADFGVAIHALEGCLSAKLMTTGALRHS